MIRENSQTRQEHCRHLKSRTEKLLGTKTELSSLPHHPPYYLFSATLCLFISSYSEDQLSLLLPAHSRMIIPPSAFEFLCSVSALSTAQVPISHRKNIIGFKWRVHPCSINYGTGRVTYYIACLPEVGKSSFHRKNTAIAGEITALSQNSPPPMCLTSMNFNQFWSKPDTWAWFLLLFYPYLLYIINHQTMSMLYL